MDKKTGLIIGIDIGEETTQAGYFDEKLNTVQSLNMVQGGEFYKNPKPFSQMVDTENGVADIDSLSLIFKNVINETLRLAHKETLHRLCITVPFFNADIFNAIRMSMARLGLKEPVWQIASHDECFAYYAYAQRKELYAAGVVLMEYDAEGIRCNRLVMKKNNGKGYIIEERYQSGDEPEFMTDAICAVGAGKADIASVEKELCEFVNSYFEKRIVSSVYLTGPGFNTDSLPATFSKLIITRRKAFVGQNLFAKGACFVALSDTRPSLMDSYILVLEDRLRVGIEFEIKEHGRDKRFRAVKPGINWFMADRTVDFILDDLREIKFRVITLDGKEYEDVIDVGDIPYREGKTTRISVNIKFMAPDRCLITVKDRGFGEFFKSSGQVIYKQLDFAELDRG